MICQYINLKLNHIYENELLFIILDLGNWNLDNPITAGKTIIVTTTKIAITIEITFLFCFSRYRCYQKLSQFRALKRIEAYRKRNREKQHVIL